ncbi:hypothetical protein K458DRAFT_458178 [Lentithecium fluviatile CBS 122367]|uniref:Uncharacterized protein n=1 Tax=Lentithecium fluviatile CBS 122367 TaxID=1168545 RepID=A0A6G1IRA1_9PLEO|nr:hypothetical protein K458DRAFT_458178 [Lentithecium fluviatile CBS 122367]
MPPPPLPPRPSTLRPLKDLCNALNQLDLAALLDAPPTHGDVSALVRSFVAPFIEDALSTRDGRLYHLTHENLLKVVVANEERLIESGVNYGSLLQLLNPFGKSAPGKDKENDEEYLNDDGKKIEKKMLETIQCGFGAYLHRPRESITTIEQHLVHIHVERELSKRFREALKTPIPRQLWTVWEEYFISVPLHLLPNDRQRLLLLVDRLGIMGDRGKSQVLQHFLHHSQSLVNSDGSWLSTIRSIRLAFDVSWRLLWDSEQSRFFRQGIEESGFYPQPAWILYKVLTGSESMAIEGTQIWNAMPSAAWLLFRTRWLLSRTAWVLSRPGLSCRIFWVR